MTTPALACAAVEVALNRYLRLEPSVIEDCARLSPRAIELRLRDLSMGFVIEFIAGGVRVMPEGARPAEVVVTATPASMIGVLRLAASGSNALPPGVDVQGDAELLQTFRAMLSRVGFDPEEWLTPLLGGVVAHRVTGGLRRLFAFGRGSATRMADQGAEYLREETYDLARGRDVGEWMDDVDRVREAVDRLEARLMRLERRT